MDKEFLNPQSVIRHFGLSAGLKVADFGTGSGEFALMAARIVGEDGLVSAIDVRDEPLNALEEKAKDEGLSNLAVIRADLEITGSTGLEEVSQDVVFIINTFFQAGDKEAVAKEAYRVLKPRGKLIVIDWTESNGEFGPPADLRIKAEKLQALIEGAGFSLLEAFKAGSYHFGMIFIKNSA